MYYSTKMYLADVVLYLSALGWCWHFEWGYAFAGIGAFATIYLTKGFFKLLHLRRLMKAMDEEIRDQWGD